MRIAADGDGLLIVDALTIDNDPSIVDRQGVQNLLDCRTRARIGRGSRCLTARCSSYSLPVAMRCTTSIAGELLLDTGALVSLLDRSQTHHQKCRRTFAAWTGPVVSIEAVLTEATHRLAGVQGGRAACVDFFLSGAPFSFLRLHVRVHDRPNGLLCLSTQGP